ncbi:MAG: hypothetical protein PUE18_03415 [Firmicutes bacterium]|nr:hypothetical protein [Bacillota bacterium]
MKIDDFIYLIQHSNFSNITTANQVDISKLKYIDLIKDILWYTYNISTRQNPYDYKNTSSYMIKPYYWNKKYDLQVKLILSILFNIKLSNIMNFSTKIDGLASLQSNLIQEKIDGHFCFFRKGKMIQFLMHLLVI